MLHCIFIGLAMDKSHHQYSKGFYEMSEELIISEFILNRKVESLMRER